MPLASIDSWLGDRLLLTQRPTGRVVMHQRWEHLLFLHWEVPAESLARLLPTGLEIDLFEGRAFVGLVPFAMRAVRPSRLPSLPWLSNFAETNVRTYVRSRDGKPGVWFFSLDAGNPIAAALGRFWFRLPYFYARMTVQADPIAEDRWTLRYAATRLLPNSPPASTEIRAEVDGPVQVATVGSLEYFLAERYLLYASGSRSPRRATDQPSLWRGRVHHTAYPLQEARLVALREDTVAAAGIKLPDSAPIVHYARQVVVEVFGLEPVPEAGPRQSEA